MANTYAGFHENSWLTGQMGKACYDFDPATFIGEFPDGPALIAARVKANDGPSNRMVQELGFRFIDTNVQLCRPGGLEARETGQTRFAKEQDREAVSAIAAAELRENRFFRDPQIPIDTAARIKAAWAGNYFAGLRGDWMVVSESDGELAGFLQLLSGATGRLIIDQIAVAARFQRKGLARAMIAFAAMNCKHTDGMQVGTQLGNSSSISLYETLGFRFLSAHYLYHLHI